MLVIGDIIEIYQAGNDKVLQALLVVLAKTFDLGLVLLLHLLDHLVLAVPDLLTVLFEPDLV